MAIGISQSIVVKSWHAHHVFGHLMISKADFIPHQSKQIWTTIVVRIKFWNNFAKNDLLTNDAIEIYMKVGCIAPSLPQIV